MRKYYAPLTVLGLAGVGILLFSKRGRNALRWAADSFQKTPETLLEWNDAAQRELDRLQAAVNRVAQSLHELRS
jgi:hypothetical protein